jgi:hypothetical protein
VKYLPGCTGTIHGHFVDKESRPWYFVTVGEDCDHLRTLRSFDVAAGWVDGLGIELGEATVLKKEEPLAP